MAKGSTGCFIDSDGDICYLLNGDFYREDGPAIIFSDGRKIWVYYSERTDSEEEFCDPNWKKE